MPFDSDEQRMAFFGNLKGGTLGGKARALSSLKAKGGKFIGDSGYRGSSTHGRLGAVEAQLTSKLTAAQVKKKLAANAKRESEVTSEMIAAGRGHQRFSDHMKGTDQLSVKFRDIHNRTKALREQQERLGREKLAKGMRRMGVSVTVPAPRTFGV